MELELPWPPSVNSYLAVVGRRKVKTKKAREYCAEVENYLRQQGVSSFGCERLKVEILAYPPDRRKRDLDNILKAIFDGLTLSGVYEDDSQIDFFSVKRCEKVKGGKVIVKIGVIDE